MWYKKCPVVKQNKNVIFAGILPLMKYMVSSVVLTYLLEYRIPVIRDLFYSLFNDLVILTLPKVKIGKKCSNCSKLHPMKGCSLFFWGVQRII